MRPHVEEFVEWGLLFLRSGEHVSFQTSNNKHTLVEVTLIPLSTSSNSLLTRDGVLKTEEINCSWMVVCIDLLA